MIGETPTSESRPSPASLLLVSSGLVLAALPLFMVGGLAVQIRADLGFSEAALGGAVTAGFVVGALSAPFGGRIADRIGARAALYLGAALSAIALFGLGGIAESWGAMAAFLAVAGIAVAVTDPGLAILVHSTIHRGRQGLAFGLKEASIPAATLLAGASVPAVALTVGWRWAFALGAVPLILVVVLLSRVGGRASTPAPVTPVTPSEDGGSLGWVVVTAVAAAMGITAASGVGVFLTQSAVTMGVTPAAAGILLVVGSIAGIAARIASGVFADRSGGPQFTAIAVMLGVGAVAIALAGTGNVVLLVIGTVGAFAGAWGWTGLYFLSLIRVRPSNPGAVSGLGVAGLGVGNAAGPLLFGLAAEHLSIRAAWVGAGAMAACAALLMLWAKRRVGRV